MITAISVSLFAAMAQAQQSFPQIDPQTPPQRDLPQIEPLPQQRVTSSATGVQAEIAPPGTSLVSATSSDAARAWITPMMREGREETQPSNGGRPTLNIPDHSARFMMYVLNPDTRQTVTVQYSCYLENGTPVGSTPARVTISPLRTQVLERPEAAPVGGYTYMWCHIQSSLPTIAYGVQRQKFLENQTRETYDAVRFYRAAP